jgi:transposase
MISLPAGARVLVATRPVDFRKGAHGLAAVASEVLGEDPFSGAVIVFRSKRPEDPGVGHEWTGAGVEATAAGDVPLATGDGRRDATVGCRVRCTI